MNFEIFQLVHQNEDQANFKVYYISNSMGAYLHKDGLTYNDTGGNYKSDFAYVNLTDYVKSPGYYETKRAAQKVLDEYNKNNKPKPTIEERLTAIELKLGIV